MGTKAETRQAILDAAQGLFLRYGPIKTSIADIARELGMSPTNIYNFYPSRDAILEAVGELHLRTLARSITADIAKTEGDWPRLAILFVSTARHMRDHLENEKDILQLQALERKNQWKFVVDFHAFLRETATNLLEAGICARRLADLDPVWAVSALFDCMISALDPLMLLKFDRADHEQRIHAQLQLLERAFR